MDLLTSVGNKIQYMFSSVFNDPDTVAFAKQRAEQAEHDKQVKDRQAKADAEAAKKESDAQTAEMKAETLVTRSKFDLNTLINTTAKKVVSIFLSLLLLCFMLYGGHLAANQAIGYRSPFRFLSFIYGALASVWVVPKAFYDVYWKGQTIPYYSFIPLSTYQPTGTLEKILIGWFCYTENEASIAAKAAVATLYSDAFKRSIGEIVKTVPAAPNLQVPAAPNLQVPAAPNLQANVQGNVQNLVAPNLQANVQGNVQVPVAPNVQANVQTPVAPNVQTNVQTPVAPVAPNVQALAANVEALATSLQEATL